MASKKPTTLLSKNKMLHLLRVDRCDELLGEKRLSDKWVGTYLSQFENVVTVVVDIHYRKVEIFVSGERYSGTLKYQTLEGEWTPEVVKQIIAEIKTAAEWKEKEGDNG